MNIQDVKILSCIFSLSMLIAGALAIHQYIGGIGYG